MSKTSTKQFGTVERMASGMFRARYWGPDSNRYTAPRPFQTKGDAAEWLVLRQAEIIKGTWQAPGGGKGETFGTYSQRWLQNRLLKGRTREHYGKILDSHLSPFSSTPMLKITPDAVDSWFNGLETGPTMKAHSYALLRTIMRTAEDRDVIPRNPCRVPKAGKSKAKRKVVAVTPAEFKVIVRNMPAKYQMMVKLALWGQMRFGELVGLRRMDIAKDGSLISVSRGIVRYGQQLHVDTPKSDTSIRQISVPPHLREQLLAHIVDHAQPGDQGLLFPSPRGVFLSPETLYRFFHPARDAAGRHDLHFHDLRHSGGTMTGRTSATLAETMDRLGHSTVEAAMKYQHANNGRAEVIATELSDLFGDMYDES